MEKYGKLPVTPYLEHRENDKAHGAYVFFFCEFGCICVMCGVAIICMQQFFYNARRFILVSYDSRFNTIFNSNSDFFLHAHG